MHQVPEANRVGSTKKLPGAISERLTKHPQGWFPIVRGHGLPYGKVGGEEVKAARAELEELRNVAQHFQGVVEQNEALRRAFQEMVVQFAELNARVSGPTGAGKDPLLELFPDLESEDEISISDEPLPAELFAPLGDD